LPKKGDCVAKGELLKKGDYRKNALTACGTSLRNKRN